LRKLCELDIRMIWDDEEGGAEAGDEEVEMGQRRR
jgi:hypothetical protein